MQGGDGINSKAYQWTLLDPPYQIGQRSTSARTRLRPYQGRVLRAEPGTVGQVGEGVSELNVGDRVCVGHLLT